MAEFRTTPVETERIPPGVGYIIGNEAAERFSYYGMRAILVVFMTQYLCDRNGKLDVMTPEAAKVWYHQFASWVYFFPLFGAVLSDVWWGKYRTIIWVSLVYCLGHLALALDDTRVGLAVGLSLIALGSGGIKPCVSANVGDQFGEKNKHLLERVFGWFYFSINFGSFFSTMMTPVLLQRYGPQVAFGVPGALMLVATVVFWLGRHQYTHVPPAGAGFLKEIFSAEGGRTLGRLALVFLFVAMFWALYDQTSSAWVLQAEGMDRRLPNHEQLAVQIRDALGDGWLGANLQSLVKYEWLSSQIHSVNPVLILLYIPLFSYVVYPLLGRVLMLSPLRRIAIGFFVAALSFVVAAWIEAQLQSGVKVNFLWQVVAHMVMTAAEVMVSITSLEFAYTQAPAKLKSLVMAVNLLAVWLGNQLTSVVNWFIQNADGSSKLPGASYYWFFVGLMTITAVAFLGVVATYRETPQSAHA